MLPAGSSKTLVDFTKKYGVEVDYEEKIGDNAAFVQTITPALVGGLPTGWDLMVLTDWMAGKIIAKKWAEQIIKANVPNCVANLREPLQNVSWDPGNDFHYPWQSGMTGVGYNGKTLAENKIAVPTKIADLWTIPSDKVTFLTEARDTFGLGLLKLGKAADPATVTAADLQAVHDDMQPLVNNGLRFEGNEYLQDFAQKKVWAAMVWSGDLASSGGEDDHFVFPEEGTMLWTDNMLIPKGAANKYTAELMMNFVLRRPRRRPDRGLRLLRLAGEGHRGRDRGPRPRGIDQSPALPATRRGRQAAELPVPVARDRGRAQRPLREPLRYLIEAC